MKKENKKQTLKNDALTGAAVALGGVAGVAGVTAFENDEVPVIDEELAKEIDAKAAEAAEEIEEVVDAAKDVAAEFAAETESDVKDHTAADTHEGTADAATATAPTAPSDEVIDDFDVETGDIDEVIDEPGAADDLIEDIVGTVSDSDDIEDVFVPEDINDEVDVVEIDEPGVGAEMLSEAVVIDVTDMDGGGQMAYIDVDGNQGMAIDYDGDGKIDMIGVDSNNDGIIDLDEQVSVTDEGLAMSELTGEYSDPLDDFASNGDNDYINNADVDGYIS